MPEKIKQVCFEVNCLQVEVADNFFAKTKGLMFRETLPRKSGVLFVFGSETVIPIWMFGMRIPLDIIWIGSDNKIKHIERDAEPCRGLFCKVFKPTKAAKYVLEVNAGVSQELGLNEEIEVDFR